MQRVPTDLEGCTNQVSVISNTVLACKVIINARLGHLVNANKNHEPMHAENLRLGFGSPGYNGCLNVQGTAVHMSILIDRETSVTYAMHKLKLHALGLSGARLSKKFALPRHLGYVVHARGGPAYGSVAVVVRVVVGATQSAE